MKFLAMERERERDGNGRSRAEGVFSQDKNEEDSKHQAGLSEILAGFRSSSEQAPIRAHRLAT